MSILHHCETPLGGVTLASDGDALTGLWFDGQKYFGSTLSEETIEKPLPVFEDAERWLKLYFSGERPDFTPKLALNGTPFRQLVWSLLLEVPYGETITYAALSKRVAARLGRASMSAQAIGGAVAHNPVSLIVPCHRVVGADGALTGYAGGVERKRALLKLESANRD